MCHLSVTPPTCKKYAHVLYWKTPCMFWPSLLACAAPYVFSWILQCVFYNFAWSCPHFCIFFPDWMVWKEVSAILARPPFARCMHLSCVESSMYVLTFTFGLRCFIFHGFFLGPGVLPCVFYNFAWFCLHFCIVFPDWMVWRGVCAILVCPHLQDVYIYIYIHIYAFLLLGAWSSIGG